MIPKTCTRIAHLLAPAAALLAGDPAARGSRQAVRACGVHHTALAGVSRCAAFVQSEVTRWTEVARKAGLKPES